MVSDIDEKKGEGVAEEIKKEGGKALAVAGDVTDPNYPQHIVQKAVEAFGKLTILVLNAGYTNDGMMHTMTEEQWQSMLLVHNTAPFRLVKAANPFFREAAKQEIEKDGYAHPRSIVTVSSTSGVSSTRLS